MISKTHQDVIDFLLEKFPFLPFETEYFIKNENVRFDIVIHNIKLFIEIQGIQHYQFSKFLHKTQESFLSSIERDKRKKSIASNMGYSILYIDTDSDFENHLDNTISDLLFSNLVTPSDSKNITKRKVLLRNNALLSDNMSSKIVCPKCDNIFYFKDDISQCCGIKVIRKRENKKWRITYEHTIL